MTPDEQAEHERALVAVAFVTADEAEWWTTSDVASYLGVLPSTVVNYRKRDQMPAPDKKVGRSHMWRPSRIVAWQESRPRPGVGGRRRLTTSGGVVLTPQVIAALVAEAEAGFDVDLLQGPRERRTLGRMSEETQEPQGTRTWTEVRAGVPKDEEAIAAHKERLRESLESDADGPTGDAGH